MSHPMRDFNRIMRDARAAFGPVDIYPTATDRRLATLAPRVTTPRTIPPLAWFLFGLATGTAGSLLAMLARAGVTP